MKFLRPNQLALVTGAAGGIGAATAQRLIASNLRVIALDRSADALSRLADATAGKVLPCVSDLKDIAGLPSLVIELIGRYGPISHLVNNAGVWPAAALGDLSPEDWHRSLDVNLTAPLMLMQAIIPAMRQSGGGAIVNVASRNAFRSSTRMAAYDAAKAGVVALTRTAAGELAADSIRVNAVCPGVIDTGGDPSIREPLFQAAYTRLIPMSRYGLPQEIAATIEFLLSDDASYITGQTIVVDGGQLACQDNQRFMEIPHLATP
jgi:NAD(P)-dependent dehydrogenase (short-subunit alcohol dehydrogenase family)